jgi:hypothetical protein
MIILTGGEDAPGSVRFKAAGLPTPPPARAEDRIRVAKDSGLTNLPLHDFAQNQIWCALIALPGT